MRSWQHYCYTNNENNLIFSSHPVCCRNKEISHTYRVGSGLQWVEGRKMHTLQINANAKCLLVINIYCINMNHIKFLLRTLFNKSC